jgi:hypothetical protein
VFVGVVLSVVLVLVVGAQLATTLTTATELKKLRVAIRSLETSRATTEHSLAKLESPQRQPRSGPLSGDLDLYHRGHSTTVRAVFRPRR